MSLTLTRHFVEANCQRSHQSSITFSLLTSEEIEQQTGWNDTRSDIADEQCLHQLIESHATENSEAVAVHFEGDSLTYGELDVWGNRIACELASCGVGPGDRVGLFVERSPVMIAGIVGILKSGAAYVPLDPTYPDAHLSDIVDDASISVVVTQSNLADSVPFNLTRVLMVDGCRTNETRESERLATHVTPDDRAYVIYTSGSTGRPKGVPIRHRSIVHSTLAREIVYPQPPARFLMLSSFAFDSSLVGIFWTLCTGGTLVVTRARFEQDLAGLLELVATEKISHTLCLPSLYQVILQESQPEQLATLQTVIVAGETCPRSLASLHHNVVPHALLFNEYGPTEATVWATVHRVEADDAHGPIPIGRPIPDMQAALLDHHGQPVPTGICGELFLAGSGLTDGYLNRPDMTAERFVTRSLHDGTPIRMYRTGDLACYREDGALLFFGRSDNQVKVWGFRIELGEIEAVLSEHPHVAEAVVVVKEEDTSPARPEGIIDLADVSSLVMRLGMLSPSSAHAILSNIERGPMVETLATFEEVNP